ncbi:dienelactone hydrolase family protein [Nakamurella flavida]|uniref:Dienelactone hydrolase family protein n=1 Tax=Nakamurella flavida TaxID=363630 RepID=A0A938YJX3_9ACTN|nr:dienelactone hydrolase family protein [Nakamurella flavida]MBM9477352.1 dienelactone hydrolase family protein [Nakamurella flavida]MDP9777284.1 dienelactone hydrolase [Nakamurella flavida]
MTHDADLSPALQQLLDSVPESGPITTDTVRYAEGDTELEGFLAAPAGSGGTLPAVLVLHDWFGVVDHVKVRARMLARLGYVALAGDLYGADVRPASNEEAAGLAGRYYGDVELFRARVLANLDALRADPRVDPDRVVVMGYCFGGSAALEVARAGADVRGVVAFHGNLGTGAPAVPGSITASVLVLTGAADPVVPDTAVATFQDEMRHAGVEDWQVVTYSGAMHAFAVPDTDAPGMGAAFQERANRRSWRAMEDFLAEVSA